MDRIITEIYFVRHAEPNYNNHDDFTRELSAKGLSDRLLVTQYLSNKSIDIVLSSPYKRAYDTVYDFASRSSLPVHCVDDFRERKVDSIWIDDFDKFTRNQWDNFDYKLLDGESLRQVQDRNIRALNNVLDQYAGCKIAVGSHGTALSTIINYFDPSFDYNHFARIKGLMPWVVRCVFQKHSCIMIESIDILNGGKSRIYSVASSPRL